MLVYLQKILPLHAISRLTGHLCQWKAGFLKNLFILYFIHHYGVNIDEIKAFDPKHYANFNEFFTRELKPGVRPIAENLQAVVSPCDGVISELGEIKDLQLLQAKGHYYQLQDLLGGETELAERFKQGYFMTIYLAPKDYHRVHMPLSGKLEQMIHVPGKLYSVNPATVAAIPNLFAMNERVINIFDTSVGSMAVILVGATNVGSIETVWHGVVTPPARKTIQQWDYETQAIELKKGDEMGRFNMGSTVIILFAATVA